MIERFDGSSDFFLHLFHNQMDTQEWKFGYLGVGLEGINLC